MKTKDDKLRRRFVALVERLRQTPIPTGPGGFKVSIRFPGKTDVALRAGVVADMYEEVLDGFFAAFSPHANSPVSRREIRHRFDRAIQDSLGRKGQGQPRRTTSFHRRLSVQSRQLLAALNTSMSDWRIYIPLRAPGVSKVTRFGNVEFMPGGSLHVRRLRASIPELESVFDIETVARLSVRAVDGHAARAIGIRQLRHTLDVLDFLEPIVEAPYLDPGTAFEAVETPGQSAVVATQSGVASYELVTYFVRARALSSRSRQSRLERAVDRLLSESDRPALKQRMSTALAWAGRANVQRRPDQAFLMKIVALEAALTKAEARGATTERLCVRVAQVLGGSTKNRRATYALVRAFYNLRNGIVHTGTASQLNDATMRQITGVTRSVLERLLTRRPFARMSSEEELEDWFEQQLLAGGKRR